MESEPAQSTWGWLLGEGDARGIALIFFFAGLTLSVLGLLAFKTKSYRLLSAKYEGTEEPVPAEELGGVEAVASDPRR